MKTAYYTTLEPFGLLQCAGVDAKKFLQGQLSCDLNNITAENTQYGLYCNMKGRVTSFFIASLFNDDYWLLMPRDVIDICQQYLQKYAIFSKLTLSDVSEDWALYGLWGDVDASLWDELTNLSSRDEQAHSIIFNTFPNSSTRYTLYCRHNLQQQVEAIFTKHLTEQAYSQWHLDNINQGIPYIYQATSEQLLPHRLNYHLIDDAISFNKGCYLGQEIIARSHYRGKLKYHSYRFRLPLATPPVPGVTVSDPENDRQLGYVIDSCIENSDHCQALIQLPIEAADIKQLKIADTVVAVERLSLPYTW